METISDSCPTGILIDVDFQTEALNGLKNNEKNQVLTQIKKDESIVADFKSSHPWTSNCLLDQSPQRPQTILKKNVFVTPKSKWKTPSPKSMKIISRDASRIVDQLYSSPVNCMETMIYDEVFPDVKSFDDDACFDEFHIKTRTLPVMDLTVADEKEDQSDPNSIDFKICSVFAKSKQTSEKGVLFEEKLSTVMLQSDIEPAKQQNDISEKVFEKVTSENVPSPESCAESAIDDKKNLKYDTGIVSSSITLVECKNVSDGQLLAPEAIMHKKLPALAKGFNLKKCSRNVLISESDNLFDEKLSKVVLQPDAEPAKHQNGISKKVIEKLISENVSHPGSCAESPIDDKENLKSGIVSSSPTIVECKNVSDEQFLAPEAITHKKLPALAEGFNLKKSMNHYAEKHQDIVHQSNKTGQTKYVPKFSRSEKPCNSIGNGTTEPKIRKNQFLKNESMIEPSSRKYNKGKYFLEENKKANENTNLEDHLSKDAIGRPKAFQPKSNVVRSQSLLCKKDPLYKTSSVLEIPTGQSSIRRIHSFHNGNTRNAIPTVGKKFAPTPGSSSRILKPKTSLNIVSNNASGFSTPLQSRCLQNFTPVVSNSANPARRKSIVFNANCSLVASDIKVAAQKDQPSNVKKPAMTSCKFGFGKKTNMPSSHSKLKSDSLPRKLFS